MDERAERIARRFELPTLVAALLVVPLIVIEESAVGPTWRLVGDCLNWVTWLVFASEVAVMLAVVPDRRRWLAEHPVELVVVVVSPPFLPASLAAARVLRLLRLVRLLRLAQLTRRVFTVEGVTNVALVAFMTVLVGGTAFAAVEDEVSGWDGIWWAITTMTTVGYGDISPSTDASRVIAVVVMAVGIGAASVAIGAVAQRFMGAERADADILAELHAISSRLAALERQAGLERETPPAAAGGVSVADVSSARRSTQ